MTIPRKEVIAKPTGMAMSWGQTAALGVFALDAKSGALVMRVNILLGISYVHILNLLEAA